MSFRRSFFSVTIIPDFDDIIHSCHSVSQNLFCVYLNGGMDKYDSDKTEF